MARNVFTYKLFVWVLLIMAIIMGGGYIVFAYTYKIQKETETDIELGIKSILVTKDIEYELSTLQNYTLIYLSDKSPRWIDSISYRQKRFIRFLEKNKNNINAPEESVLLLHISALFSNFEQNINQIKILENKGDWKKANALLLHSGKDLLPTIRSKSAQLISFNQHLGSEQKKSIERVNSIVFRIMISLGIIGVCAGLAIGWIISRILFNPINQLILTIKGASGEAVIEKLKIPSGDEISELGTRIQKLIDQSNQTRDDLKKNQQLLQYSNKYATLGKIAPTIAHEIRNPLTSIKMLVYSIKEESELEHRLKQDFEIILKEIDRMEEFIKNFLKFSKPAETVFNSVNIQTLINDIILLLTPQFKKNNVDLKLNFHTDKRIIQADAAQLKQLFMNLILNAMEAMNGNGTLKLNISTVSKISNLEKKYFIDYLCVSIEDTGPGIPDKVLRNLFEPFVRGSEQGVGLGLSISQNIASMHHGWIEGENKPDGRGAIFKTYIPISEI